MTPQSLLLSEIHEQPAALRRLLEAEADHASVLARQIRARPFHYVLIAARGSSDNAGRYGQYLFGALNRLPVALAAPSLFTLYDLPPRLENVLVLGISQSGQSPDIVGVLAEARRQGAPTVAITNDPASPLAQAAEHSIQLHVGPERSVAATKTYTAQLAALALLACALAGQELPGPLAEVPGWISRALEVEEQARQAAERIAASDRAVVIGRGFNYATAFEAALKAKELACVEAEPYSPADFKHGPIAMVEAGFPVVLVNMGPTFRQEMGELSATLKGRRVPLVTLSDAPAPADPASLWISLPPGMPEWLTPLVSIIPGQLLAYHLARSRGFDPDQPRAIGKVTLTH